MKKSLLLSCLILLSSCSVVMASRKEGADLKEVQKIKTREELTALDLNLAAVEEGPDGQKIEIYQFLKTRQSITRAYVHGLLDLTTLFAWEFIGTPIEGAIAENRHRALKVTFDKNDQILNMEIQ